MSQGMGPYVVGVSGPRDASQRWRPCQDNNEAP